MSKHPQIAKALERIRREVDVPVVLPPYLPHGLHLAPQHPVDRVGWHRPGYVLILDWRDKGEFLFQFGAAMFDGCGALSAHAIEIRGHPALIQTDRRDDGAEVIWPATPSHPTGTYGIRGPLPAREIVALAESMPVLTGRGHVGDC